MAITTIDGVIAGLQPPQNVFKVGPTMEAAGVMHSLLYATGLPGAGTAPSMGINGSALTSLDGQIPFTNPTGGAFKYLARADVSSTVFGTLLLFDRLWHNSGIVVTTTTAQTITFPGLPARDMGGTTDGVGVQVGIEVVTATTNASAIANTTISYTNSAGTAGRTGTIASFPATAVAGTFVPFALAAGDVGVRSVQSITLGTTYGGGAISLVAYRQVARVSLPLANGTTLLDAVQLGMPRLYDNTVLFPVWLASSTSGVTLHAQLVYAEG